VPGTPTRPSVIVAAWRPGGHPLHRQASTRIRPHGKGSFTNGWKQPSHLEPPPTQASRHIRQATESLAHLPLWFRGDHGVEIAHQASGSAVGAGHRARM